MKFTKFMLVFSLCLMVFGIKAQVNSENPTSNPDTEAMFIGGIPAFKKYLKENTVYPKSAKEDSISGKVYVRFIVEKDGSISAVEILRGVNEALDAEAMRVVGEMPNWTPAESEGKRVRSYVIIPINFELS